MRGRMTTEAVDALVRSVRSEVHAYPERPLEQLDARVDAAIAQLEAETQRDRADAEDARRSFRQSGHTTWGASGLNPSNWRFWAPTGAARAQAQTSLWPREADLRNDEMQLLSLRSMQGAVRDRALAQENASLRTAREFFVTEQVDPNAIPYLLEIVARHGARPADVLASYLSAKAAGLEPEDKLALVRPLFETNRARAAAHLPVIDRDELRAVHTMFVIDGAVTAHARLTGVYLRRLAAAEIAARRTFTPDERERIRGSVYADFAHFQAQHCNSRSAALLTEAIGGTATRASLLADYQTFERLLQGRETYAAADLAVLASTRTGAQRRSEVLRAYQAVKADERTHVIDATRAYLAGPAQYNVWLLNRSEWFGENHVNVIANGALARAERTHRTQTLARFR